jgi:hypothetical protein
VAGALATQLEGPEQISLDVARAIDDGASASDVARAIPSSINSMQLIPLGGEALTPAPRQPAAEAQGLRQALAADADLELDIAEPALETGNPAQASALDITLDVVEEIQPQKLPAWATRGGSSARLSKVGPPAKRPRSKSHGGLIAAVLLTLASAGGAVAYFFLR